MDVIVVDTDARALAETVASVKVLYPNDDIYPFTDPLLAIQHGYGAGESILFTALELRRASGFEVARLIRRAHVDYPEVHFIARDESLRRDAEQFGAVSYTVKPVTPEKLRASIAEYEE